ncbi:hypothetical protein AMS68_004481 [Peltaster fructicola]|uniref:Thioredoxin domain-containing protein n=1 Tax=Peltaster fructicola TaxID=286661 RepID=A0A6H0XW64_9PEZI|nr:hypothetical protein AMS68_004481 [Peltaster fructicola]
MRLWPFTLRRQKTMNDTAAEPLTEKSGNLQGTAAPVTRPSVASETKNKRRSRQAEKAEMIEDKDATRQRGKENIEGGYRRRESVDEITALPVKWKLEHSPHLRPVDSDRAQIPYNFLNEAYSQTSVGPTEGSSSRPGTLRSKRSTVDGTSLRRKSTKKRPDERLREEEIRAMSAAVPLPKRPGDGPPRRDSYKRRTFTSNEAASAGDTLPASAPSSAAAEQPGWEIQHFWSNPRPAVRLSYVPAYPSKGTVDTSIPLSREMEEKARDKTPMRKEGRRHKTIGAEADALDSNDIRAVLERDAKRREKKERERQERLDRKLRAVDKSRRNSGKSRKPAEADKALEAGFSAAPQRPVADRAPTSVHPALRDEPHLAADVGLGIIDQAQPGAERDNPFVTPVTTPVAEDKQLEKPAETLETPLETPFDDPPVIHTAREVRMATAITPPLSPVEGRRPSLMALDALPPQVASTSVPAPQRTATTTTARTGSQSKERRAGAWASFFTRANTQREAKVPETSFANTSRESMSRPPVPLHLTTTQDSAFRRSSTGTPTRTLSKFREDLPDAPTSARDSRIQSPELPANAAAIAAAAAAQHALNTQEDTQGGAAATEIANARSDTPVSPIRHGTLSASMASVDSEGSWLASGGSIKRASVQSGLSRSLGSFRRTPDFNASFEDLGVASDRDAEYFQDAQRTARARASASLVGASLAENEIPGTPPLTVHESLRKKPTLVHRQPAARSREGLLSDFSAGEIALSDSPDEDELQSAAWLPVFTCSCHRRDASSPAQHLYKPQNLSSTLFRPKQSLYQPILTPRFYANMSADLGVHNLKGKSEFDEKVTGSDKLVILDCYATWCGPCKVIAPKIVEFSHKYTDAKFYKLDVDESPDVAQELGVRAMPTFFIFKNGEKIAEVVGANPVAVEKAITANL